MGDTSNDLHDRANIAHLAAHRQFEEVAYLLAQSHLPDGRAKAAACVTLCAGCRLALVRCTSWKISTLAASTNKLTEFTRKRWRL